MIKDLKQKTELLRKALNLFYELEEYFGYDNTKEGKDIGVLIDEIQKNDDNF
jgi:hypothetical protein|tara:strand:+ start:1565 stop:1720 length:156 start_codon:yes stop_codon:yes gene_type:complete